VNTALTEQDLAAVDVLLAGDDRRRQARYPGESLTRQPVHTVYVPADRMTPTLPEQWGEAAAAALATHAADAAGFATATGHGAADVEDVWAALTRKLSEEPIEDLRIDLEDGYGQRADDDEDEHAVAAGRAVQVAAERGVLPPYVGVRIKSLEAPTRRRGIRSLDLVLGAVLAGGQLPAGWIQTLPKVTSTSQVTAMVEVCARLERAHGLPEGRLRFEVQVETPQAILGPDGTAMVARLIEAAAGRCSALHFGTYDYTAALGIAGGYQAMDHPAADHAKATMQVAAAETGVRLSDGSTNVLPVGDTRAVHAAWRLHAGLVRRSLERGFYQGWDLHPAQLPTRFLATFLFYRQDREAVGRRLAGYLRGAVGGVLDEPATARALASFLLRGIYCGALTAEEVLGLAGTDVEGLIVLAGRPGLDVTMGGR